MLLLNLTDLLNEKRKPKFTHSTDRLKPRFFIESLTYDKVNSFKYLGLTLDNTLLWNIILQHFENQMRNILYYIKNKKFQSSTTVLLCIYLCKNLIQLKSVGINLHIFKQNASAAIQNPETGFVTRLTYVSKDSTQEHENGKENRRACMQHVRRCLPRG